LSVLRGASPLLVIGLASSWVGAALAAPTPTPKPLVTMLAAQTARSAPSAGASAVARIGSRTRLTGIATVLPVLESTTGGWLRVSLAGRPNGRSGWIRSDSTRRTATAWRVAVDLSSRTVTVLRVGRAVRTFRAVVGKPSTPTPTGSFFVEEPVRLGAGAAGGPYALALSARSNVLQEFDGGPGQIAIHGRDNVGGTLGTAASHGCVRLADNAMRWLVGRVGAGTPVTIKS
jgi:lipoprotein-anchoring transpeptidase ErfK/SrfK